MYAACFCLDTDMCNIIQNTDLLLSLREIKIFYEVQRVCDLWLNTNFVMLKG